MDEGVTAIMASVTLLALLPACYCDYRCRTVPNLIWWILGVAGIAFLFFWTSDGRSFQWQYLLLMVGVVLITAEMLVFEIKSRATHMVLYLSMALCFIVPCIVDFDDVAKTYLAVGVSFALFYALYLFGIIKGGADVKCLVALSFMFPVCPTFFGFPSISVPPSLEYAMPFSVAVLFHAALFSFAWLFWIVLRKVLRKNDPVKLVTLTCYTMSIDEARKSHVWSKQDVKDGMVVNVNYIPDDGVYDRLEAAGARTVWVAPIIPFIIPITIATAFVLFVGNILFIPFG